MGTRGKAIVKCDVAKLIEMLNKALASEWQAYYNYEISAALVRGVLAPAAASEFSAHAESEKGHADRLVSRIIELGGTPLTDIGQIAAGSPITKIDGTFVTTLLQQTISGEQVAIDTYQELFLFTAGDQDAVTNLLAQDLLKDEVEHENDLQILLEDASGTAGKKK